jgi:phosphate transport system protein
MAPGVRIHFEQRLAQLKEDVLQLGALARRAVARGLKALADADQDLAREVIVEDISLNRLRFDVETQCYALLATEQPVASDMRAIVAALIIVNDLERIGDHGKMVARIYLRMLEDPRPIPLGDIGRLGEMSLTMLDRALRALASRDVEEAQAICRADDEVDAFYKQTFNVVLSYMLENPRLIGAGTHLLQVAHELERVGDRATNIAERVIYTVTGELIDLNM